MTTRATAGLLRRAFFLALCLSSVGLQGCGLGWLYMRIGDSHRIHGAKILEYDTTADRFRKAQESYKRALQYYQDSLLYDQVGNLDLYHKYGFTYLQLSPPDLDNARKQFEEGLKVKREKADKAGTTDTLATTADEDYSQMNAGMGTVVFWTAIATKQEEKLEEALKYYASSEATSTHVTAKHGGFFDKAMDWMNLREFLTPVPARVLAARVHLYRARKLQERGHADRAKTDLNNAKEAIEDALINFPDDPRALAEQARMHYLKGEFEACVKVLKDLSGKRSYADEVENSLLRARALVELGKPDDAIAIFTEIHDRFASLGASGDSEEDKSKTLTSAIKKRNANVKETQDKSVEAASEPVERDPSNIQSVIGRAHAFAAKGELQSATADVEYVLRLDPKDPRLFLEAGKAFMTLKNYDSAISRLLAGYYIDTKDIAINYWLGKAYEASGKKDEMRDCFRRVFNLDPTSSFAKEVQVHLK
ncbi:MAG: tetratricopeptide repeat protein [Candidatus Wallbacteria bacterium]|nr:tetratricopeptide repeat protein [Candidatus Wallbacteria bacterium]